MLQNGVWKAIAARDQCHQQPVFDRLSMGHLRRNRDVTEALTWRKQRLAVGVDQKTRGIKLDRAVELRTLDQDVTIGLVGDEVNRSTRANRRLG